MPLPRLLPSVKDGTDAVVLTVFAPFGGDETLTTYPDGQTRDLAQHPLMHALLEASHSQVHVVALIDLCGQDSFLVEIPAGKPAALKVSSRWKQDMTSANTLAGLLIHAHQSHPTAAVVLAIEGHGAGYLPEIDRAQLTLQHVSDDGKIDWHLTRDGGAPMLPAGAPILPAGAPILPAGCPILPAGCPILPAGTMPLATPTLGEALRQACDAGVPRISVIHFDNCFNMSVEVLHTVAPYAEFAAGYCNYNFFTAGAPYVKVFKSLHAAHTATPRQLADWFCDANHAQLAAKGHHPTVGGVVELARMQGIAEAIDDLADALLSALRSAAPAQRPAVVEQIRKAIVAAQQYDTVPSFELETPDQLTDIRSFANQLLAFDFGAHKVSQTATALRDSLDGIKRYGDNDSPWMDETQVWRFGDPMLAMNIFLPDPALQGLWDWRAPFYLEVNPDPTRPRIQPHIIDFVKVTDWVDFIIEYHKDVAFNALLPALLPVFPTFNAAFKPQRVPTTPPGKRPGQTNGGGAGTRR